MVRNAILVLLSETILKIAFMMAFHLKSDVAKQQRKEGIRNNEKKFNLKSFDKRQVLNHQ